MSGKIIRGVWDEVKGSALEGLNLTEMMNALNCLSTAGVILGGEAYQKGLLELMEQHYKFYEQLEDEDYVTSGSVLSCSKSKYPEKDILTLPVDHGVEAPNGRPLATCSDCRAGEHIGNFGICKCEPTGYLKVLMIKNQPEGFDYSNGYKCVPLLRHGWILKGSSGIVVVEDEVRGDLEEALLSSSALICQYGGVISIEEVPKSEDSQEKAQAAYQILNKWLLGGYVLVSKEELDAAIQDLAEYGDVHIISSLLPITLEETSENKAILDRILKHGSKEIEYDDMILAWTNYWNMTMAQNYGEKYVPVRPEVVKAMVLIESNLGEKNSLTTINQNGSRDIMQSLDPRNSVVWIVVGEKPKDTITVIRAEDDVIDLDVEERHDLKISQGAPGAGGRSYFGNGSWEIIHEIISPDLKEYYAENVTPELSLAVGIGYYCMQLNGAGKNGGESLMRDEFYAVFNYNVRNGDNYCWGVNCILENMGVELLSNSDGGNKN